MKYWMRACEALELYIKRGDNLESAIESKNYREAIELFKARDTAFSNYRAYVHLAERAERDGEPDDHYSRLVERAEQQNEKLKVICVDFVRSLTVEQRRLVKYHQAIRADKGDPRGRLNKLAN